MRGQKRVNECLWAVLPLSLAALLIACTPSKPRPRQPTQPPPGQYPAQNQQQGYPGQNYPAQAPAGQAGAPAQPPPATQPPAPTPAAPPFNAQADPINRTDIAWLRQRAQQLLQELIAALPAAAAQRVQNIPLVIDDTVGDVNAFAACVDGRSLMAITDGLLDISAHLAQGQAFDELFGTRKVDEYVGMIAQYQRPEQPIVRPAAGFFPEPQASHPQKLARQHQVLDELIAFVLAHELGHHHLGHLPCTAQPGFLGTGQIARVLSGAVPVFNQPNELAADVAGTNNVLSAGKRRSANSYRLTEAGGLLTMRFFAGLRRGSTAEVILFSFQTSHPAPQVRTPVIQQTANAWRLTGGTGLPVPVLGG